MRNLFKKIVSKSKIKPELGRVLVTKDHLVATDSFTLIEVNRKCFTGDDDYKLKIIDNLSKHQILLKPEELDLENELLKVYPVNENYKFPEYKGVMPENYKDYYSINLDPRKLINVAKAICDTTKSKFKEITLYIPKDHSKPVVLERKDKMVVGLVMPMID